MTSPRSASGARQGGDDFQHLIAWNRTLRSLPPERGLVAVEVEALDVGNVDDVVIRSSAHRDEFTQVRFGVDGATPINTDYLTSFTGKGTSLLTKFHRTWQHLGGVEARPHLQLITNKVADPSDPLLSHLDGRTSTLTPALRSAAPGSALSKAGTHLAEHLGVDCAELFALLDDLRLRLGCHYANEVEHATSLMLASGMHHDEGSVRRGIDLVRQWVLDGRRRLEADEVRLAIAGAGLVARAPWSTLLIQGINHDPHADDADITLDFVDLYEGGEPNARRQVRDGGYDEMHALIRHAAADLRAQGHRRVMVTGAMRLGTWFAAGEALSEVAGHTVLCGRPSQPWTSDMPRVARELDVRTRPIDTGSGLVVALAFAADPTDDVEAFVRRTGLETKTLLTVSTPDGARIAEAGEANGYASAIKQAVRDELRRTSATEVHLFIAAPAGLTLVLGHTWNRVAPTTVWEDLGVSGYARAFNVAG